MPDQVPETTAIAQVATAHAGYLLICLVGQKSIVRTSHSEVRRLGAAIDEHQFARRRIVTYLEQVLKLGVT